jgi:hypothetical protein
LADGFPPRKIASDHQACVGASDVSNGTKKGGILSSLVEAAKHELFVEDETAPKGANTPDPSLAQSGQSAGNSAPAPDLSPAAADVDPEALKLVKATVYTDVGGHDSRFVKFLKMLQALGRPQDALRALQVADESITTSGILEDISAHLAMLDQCTQTATAQFDAASQERLGGRDKQIEALQAANQNAANEIERHQKETSERNGKIATLQQARADDEAKITAARQREAGAEAAVRAELKAMQQLFTSKG